MAIKCIFAQSRNGIIGHGNKLPWHIPAEFAIFKEKTINGIVVMGRKTWATFNGKPLPKRKNIVLSREHGTHLGKCHIYQDIQDVIDEHPTDDLWIIGGKKLIESTIDLVDELHVTTIDLDVVGNIKAPVIDYTRFESIDTQNFVVNGSTSFKIEIFKKI